jgi:hypothetical protein
MNELNVAQSELNVVPSRRCCSRAVKFVRLHTCTVKLGHEEVQATLQLFLLDAGPFDALTSRSPSLLVTGQVQFRGSVRNLRSCVPLDRSEAQPWAIEPRTVARAVARGCRRWTRPEPRWDPSNVRGDRPDLLAERCRERAQGYSLASILYQEHRDLHYGGEPHDW